MRHGQASESLKQLEHDLVGAVGAPHLFHRELRPRFLLEVLDEGLAQFDVFAVRIAVECGRHLLDALHYAANHGVIRRIRVLIDVQAHRNVKLRAP